MIVSIDSHIQWLCAAFLQEFKMGDIGCPTWILDMDIDLRSDGSIHLFQRFYITKLQHKFNPTSPPGASFRTLQFHVLPRAPNTSHATRSYYRHGFARLAEFSWLACFLVF